MALTEQTLRPAASPAGTSTSMIPRATTLISPPDCPPAVAEAYLTLRTNLDFALLGTPGHVVMGAPIEQNAAAAQVVANLAIALAASGDEVLLVDCDLHQPALHTVFGLSGERGLRDLLGQPWTEHDLLTYQPVLPNLHVLPAGPALPSALSTAATNELAETVERLKSLADRVVLLGPPILDYRDSLTLVPYVDGLFTIVNAQGTRRDALRRARGLLARVNATLIGAVVLDGGDARQAGSRRS